MFFKVFYEKSADSDVSNVGSNLKKAKKNPNTVLLKTNSNSAWVEQSV